MERGALDFLSDLERGAVIRVQLTAVWSEDAKIGRSAETPEWAPLELKRKSSGVRSAIEYFTGARSAEQHRSAKRQLLIEGGVWSVGYVWSVEQ